MKTKKFNEAKQYWEINGHIYHEEHPNIFSLTAAIALKILFK